MKKTTNFNLYNITKILLIFFVISWFIILVIFPVYGIIQEILKYNISEIIDSITSETSLHSFKLTFLITLITVFINVIIGIIVSLVIVKHRFKGKLLIEGLIDLPFAVSPVVAGFMLIILFGPSGWLGKWFINHNIKIIYAFPSMLLATLFVTFPFVIREIVPVLKEYGLEQEEAAIILGANKWQNFWYITLPSIKWGVIYGITLTIARSIGEFGAVAVVSGNILKQTQTATLNIHQQFTDFNYIGAFSSALVLAIISFLILTFIEHFFKNKV
jgi:sulfate transport system permease protein